MPHTSPLLFRVRLATSMTVVALVAALAGHAVGVRADEHDPALPTVAFVARSDNPVDALAAGAVAGQLGGVVALTRRTALVDDAAAILRDADPDLVVLAGGTAALTDDVEAAVRALLPDAVVRRESGVDRNETARKIAELLLELGAGQPLVTGAAVAGDADLRGHLSVDDLTVRGGLDADTLGGLAAEDYVTADDLDGPVDADTLGGLPPAAYLPPEPETVTERATCQGRSFRPTSSSNLYGGFSNVGLEHRGGTALGYTCELHFPHGAQLRTVFFRLADHSTTGRIHDIRFRAATFQGSLTQLGLQTDVTTTVGTPGTFTTSFAVPDVPAATVDATSGLSYGLEITMSQSTGSPDGNIVGIIAAEVVYDIERLP